MPKQEPTVAKEGTLEVVDEHAVHRHKQRPTYHTLRLVSAVLGILLLASVILNIAQALGDHTEPRREFGQFSANSDDGGPRLSVGGSGPPSGAMGMGMRTIRGSGLDVSDYLKSDGTVDTDKAKAYVSDAASDFNAMTLNCIEEAIKLAKSNNDITSAQADALLSAFGISSSSL